MTVAHQTSIRLAAVGDLLFTTRPDGTATKGLESLSTGVRELFSSCDVVIANLESTLTNELRVSTEPLVLATENQVRSLAGSGINIVTLGNNHASDCFEAGFRGVVDLLKEMNVEWFGAGLNDDEAARPHLIEMNGVSIAFLGVVDVSSGPYQFASGACAGVVPLDVDRLCQTIRNLKKRVDHVVVSPHWGRERLRIPSPEQINQAHRLVEAGATMILGHHPHVMQGMETYQGAPIAYSLGNFLANKVYWQSGDHIVWSRFERTGCIMVADINPDRISNVEQIPVYDNGETVSIDNSGQGRRYLDRANHLLLRGVNDAVYRQEKIYVEKLRPLVAQLRWSKLKRIRPGHFNKLLKLLSQ